MVKTAGSIFSPNISGPIRRRVRVKYPDLVIKTIAHYFLDGNANDASGYGLHGTANGVTWPAGKINQAALFDGAAYIQLPASNAVITAASPWSICAWAERTALSVTRDQIFGFHRGDEKGSAIYLASIGGSKLQFGYHTGAEVLTRDTVGFTADTWHHVALTYDGIAFRVYLNGNLADSVVNTFSGFGSYPAFIGAYSAVDDAYKFIGPIDDVRCYDKALTLATIRAIYNSGNGTQEEVQ
ncbi:MAG TPA: LamG domain-containing protein [Thermoguttaceae bacterium]|nr:LamG domain-containing protein [Thermoguttaceae bacterium]